MKHIEVVAAIIVHDGKILCTQRSVNKYVSRPKKSLHDFIILV